MSSTVDSTSPLQTTSTVFPSDDRYSATPPKTKYKHRIYNLHQVVSQHQDYTMPSKNPHRSFLKLYNNQILTALSVYLFLYTLQGRMKERTAKGTHCSGVTNHRKISWPFLIRKGFEGMVYIYQHYKTKHGSIHNPLKTSIFRNTNKVITK